MKQEEKLMVELARLVDRYGSEPFKRLATILRNPEESANLASVLEGVVSVSPPAARVRGRAARVVPGLQILEEVNKTAPEKHEFLAAVRDKLASGDIFRSMNELRRFADENGIWLGSANSRSKAIVPILRYLALLSIDEAKGLLQPYESLNDRSLARWSEVIMGSGQPEPSQKS